MHFIISAQTFDFFKLFFHNKKNCVNTDKMCASYWKSSKYVRYAHPQHILYIYINLYIKFRQFCHRIIDIAFFYWTKANKTNFKKLTILNEWMLNSKVLRVLFITIWDWCLHSSGIVKTENKNCNMKISMRSKQQHFVCWLSGKTIQINDKRIKNKHFRLLCTTQTIMT